MNLEVNDWLFRIFNYFFILLCGKNRYFVVVFGIYDYGIIYGWLFFYSYWNMFLNWKKSVVEEFVLCVLIL